MPTGIVSVVYGGRCEVLDGLDPLPCFLRGRLKREATTLAVGDRVEYRRLDERTGVVERILQRHSVLARSRRERPRRRASGPPPEQVVLANPDQVVFVAAARDPGLDFALMDRALALARGARLPAAICVNKMDLAPAAEIHRLMRPYERLAVPLVYASAVEGGGLEALHDLLRGRLSFFWGGSGVGKSSLIGALTGAPVRIGAWRTDNPRGPHTTNVTRLYPLPAGGLIADTPGFDWLELDTVDGAPDRVAVLLPEAAPFAPRCRFPGCTHCGEPDCAVMAAVLAGELDRLRYARFRAQAAETGLAPHAAIAHPADIIAADGALFFRMREGNTHVWSTFHLHQLFEPAGAERWGLLDALGVPPDASPPAWVVLQERTLAGGRAIFTGKLTAEFPIGQVVASEDEVILRERGVVKGIGRIREARLTPDPWRLRKALKGTPLYDLRAFWSDLKPPSGARMPPVHAACLAIDGAVRFDALPALAMGALTRQAVGIVLDFLEVGGSEDELAK
jgi:ribosome biogenesis GTPase